MKDYVLAIVLVAVLLFALIAYAKGDITLPQANGPAPVQFVAEPIRQQQDQPAATPETVIETATPQPTAQSFVTVQPDLDVWGTSTAYAATQLPKEPASQPSADQPGTPTAISPYAPPAGGYTADFLQACAAAFSENRRAHPRCPTNADDMLAGTGR